MDTNYFKFDYVGVNTQFPSSLTMIGFIVLRIMRKEMNGINIFWHLQACSSYIRGANY